MRLDYIFLLLVYKLLHEFEDEKRVLLYDCTRCKNIVFIIFYFHRGGGSMKKMILGMAFIGFVSVSYAHSEIQFPLRGNDGELILGLGNLAEFDYSSDGKYVATAGTAGAFLWDANTGSLLRRFGFDSQNYNTMAFTPDSSKILALNWDKAILWDVQTGAEIFSFNSHLNAQGGLAISPDSRYAYIGSYNNASFIVEKWDLSTGTFVNTMAPHTGTLGALDVSADGKFLATGGGDGYARFWDVETGEMVKEFSHKMNVDSVKLSSDNRYLVTELGDNQHVVWNLSSGKMLLRINSSIAVLGFSPDNSQLITMEDGKMNYLNIASSTKDLVLNAPDLNDLMDCQLSPDGKCLLICVRYTSRLNVWSIAEEKYRCSIQGHMEGVYSCSFSPDETKVFATGEQYGSFYEFDAVSGTLSRAMNFQKDYLSAGAVGYSQDGQYVALSNNTKKWIKVWNSATGDEILSVSGPETVGSLSFSSDKKRILSGGGQSNTWAALWDVTTADPILFFIQPSAAAKTVVDSRTNHLVSPQCYSWDHFGPLATFSSDESKLVTVSGSHMGYMMDQKSGTREKSSVRIWDANTGELIQSFPAHSNIISSVAISRDNQWIVTGSDDKTAKFWNANTGEELWTFAELTDSVIAVALSPDNRYVLASSPDQYNSAGDNKSTQWVVLLNAQTGQKMGSIHGPSAPIASMSFSSDGERILVGSTDGTIRIWNVDDLIRVSAVEDFQLY